MPGKAPKRDKARQRRNALARWESEGGAPASPRQKARERRAALQAEDERTLRRLGAAVILQWSDLPRTVQRALFERAVSMGEPRNTAALKEEIARFLHTHKRKGRGE